MSARIIDGKRVAERMREQIRAQVEALSKAGRSCKLTALIVGEPPSGMLYARSQAKRCQDIGIDYELVQLPDRCTSHCVAEQIEKYNKDPQTTGIMLHLPLPAGINAPALQYLIDPYKDVEGVNPANIGMVFYDQPIIAPCTALAAMAMAEESGLDLRGSEAVVVGQGPIVGMPASVLLIQRFATVTCCHVATRNLENHTKKADLLIVAVGKPGLITAEHIKPGAVVIDVGINRIQTVDESGNAVTRTVGDVDFESARDVAGAISPVPGGVGPVTVTMLLRNTLEAARKQLNRQL